MPEVPEQITPRGLADYLEVLTKAAFQSGISWRVIEAKWDGFREAFRGFDPEVIADFGPDDVERLAQDTRIVRNRRKIEATIHNAEAILRLEAEYGFRTWLRSHGSFDDTVRAMRSEFKFLGPTGIYYFLYVVGEEVPPHEEVMR